MSATPKSAIYATYKSNAVMLNLKTNKRYGLIARVQDITFSEVPADTIFYGNPKNANPDIQLPTRYDVSGNVIKGAVGRCQAHPSLTSGLNPGVQLRSAIVDYMFTLMKASSTHPGVFSPALTFGATKSSAIQALGRTYRGYANSGIVYVTGLEAAISLRFKGADPLPLPESMQFINDSYLALSKPPTIV